MRFEVSTNGEEWHDRQPADGIVRLAAGKQLGGVAHDRSAQALTEAKRQSQAGLVEAEAIVRPEEGDVVNAQPHTLVVGAGSWGTAVANLLADKGVPTTIWAREAEVVSAISTKRDIDAAWRH